MADSWDDMEKRAVTRAVKFILQDAGTAVQPAELEKIALKASEAGFKDFRSVFDAIDGISLTDDELEGFMEQAGGSKRKFDILRLAVEITEARALGNPEAIRFARAMRSQAGY